ncbi:hypothetical protein YB2330_005057 [Saitoella coloradoensis]
MGVKKAAEEEGGAEALSVDSMDMKPDQHLSAENWRESAARDTEYSLMGIVEGVEGVEDESGVHLPKDDVVKETMGLTSYGDNTESDWDKGSDTQPCDRLESPWDVRAKPKRERESVTLSEVQDTVTGDPLRETDMDSEKIAKKIEFHPPETEAVENVAMEENEPRSIELEMHDQTSTTLLPFPRDLELSNPVYALTHQQPPSSPPHMKDTYRYIRNRREQRKEDLIMARRNSLSAAKELEDEYGRGTPPVSSFAMKQGGEGEDVNDERGTGVVRQVESREKSPQPEVKAVRPRWNPRKRSISPEMEMEMEMGMDEEVEDRSKKRKKVELAGISDPRMLFHRGLPELEDVEGWK